MRGLHKNVPPAQPEATAIAAQCKKQKEKKMQLANERDAHNTHLLRI